MIQKSPEELLQYYDDCLKRHGDTALGAAWPNEDDRQTRFKIMQSVIPDTSRKVSVCEVACGTGDFYHHLKNSQLNIQQYVGIDLSEKAISLARKKYPDGKYIAGDLLGMSDDSIANLTSDYVVANGLFTVRSGLSQKEMWEFMTIMIEQMWKLTDVSLAFNVMSAVLDWRRDDLFHVEMDRLAEFLYKLAGRRIIFRSDYDLYEYTTYVFRDNVEFRMGSL